MPKITVADVTYALRHPALAGRYFLRRDRIDYDTCSRYLPDAPVIIEAGAFDGTNSREFCRYWSNCQVYAFEPVPAAFERLSEVASEFPGRIHPANLALGNRSMDAEMHVSGNSTGGGEQSSSLLAPAATLKEFPSVEFLEKKTPVRVTRLDEWAEIAGVKRVDFLWLDLQGMELAALQGCGKLLEGVSAIHCEVQHLPLYKGAPLYEELAEWLRGKNFRPACKAVFRRGGNVLFTK